jgi:hypothetical protein
MIRWPSHRYMGMEDRERGDVFSSWKSNFLGLDRLQIANKNTEKRKRMFGKEE